ncbi:hypothetical protein [Sphingomonas sp. Leaf257]|uniref:hypothetical protein n=1 Tax=Sphingomonas sp. Leaf257 TaxID=1736309 RepID=UPI000AE1826B|nr:hypothetical protein [Sphingomonas sp. Leaf257]
MAVKFLKSTQVGTIYNTDEVAAFDAQTEKELIEAKSAEEYKEPKKAAPAGAQA